MADNDSEESVIPYPDPDLPVEKPVTDESDARDISEDDDSVDIIFTSPPYWQKRDYGFEEQIGQEETPDEFTDTLIDCMNEWKRVLKPTGSLFLNIGDTYDNRSLVGIPEMLMRKARNNGWLVRNKILWAKPSGMPEPAPNRLANRHEYIFHFTRNNDYYYDLHAYSKEYGNGSNPGDVWTVNHDRNTGDHLAPFPSELPERALTMAGPRAVCSECGEPLKREMVRTTNLDKSRDQARRAMEIYEESELEEKHIRAIQSVGISDAGKAMDIQDGTGRNADDVQELADEAKEVLGGYFREFTFPKKETGGWEGCDCDAPTEPGVALDPFMGSGTTLQAALKLNLNAVGVDLDPVEDFQMPIQSKSKTGSE